MHSSEPMATILIPFLVAVAGALVYGFAANPKLSELARITFFVGVMWTVYDFATGHVHF
jgi:hypothetical protein